ncbi:MAG: hypothetical protein V4661_14925 [Pseudomonadota bacterium]
MRALTVGLVLAQFVGATAAFAQSSGGAGGAGGAVGDPAIDKQDKNVDRKIKSICKGC